MEFKNKQKKGWILEEIEKKTECLESKNFGGEEPEDVEKHQEEVNKEINKRFDGVKKVAQKVVGQDFEEHAKPHKVEVYYVGRKDLGEAIGKLKEQNINYTIKRSPKDGFRYVVEYFSNEHKKDEPLLEKIDLEEEDAREGFISGAEELSHDELANLEKSLWDKLGENEIHPEDGTFSNSSNRLADLDLYMVIDGDWKHDHLLAEHLVEEWCKENGYVIIKHTSEEIGDSDSDDYKAEHKWFLIKDTDGKMGDTVAGFKKMFSKPEDDEISELEGEEVDIKFADESLKEDVETRMYAVYSDKDDGPTMDEIKGAIDEIDSKIEDVKEQGDGCYSVYFKASKDNLFKVLDSLGIPHEDDSEYIVNEVLDDEELPDAIPEEPIVVSTEPEGEAKVVEEPTEEVKKAGLYNALSSELRDTLQDIENLKSLTVTFIEEGREDLIDDLNAIIDERTIHSGMLQQLMTRVEGKVEAEETNTEPVKEESLNENLGDDIEKELKKYADDFEYVADAYDDDNKDIMVFATRNEEAKDKALKELGDKLGLKDAGYDDREKAWCISKRANREAKESLEEAKEETIHLDKYEIDDKDSEEQKEDAKIMPYGEVTKKQWEDFLSKAKWPYWLAWENLKNEVEHKDESLKESFSLHTFGEDGSKRGNLVYDNYSEAKQHLEEISEDGPYEGVFSAELYDDTKDKLIASWEEGEDIWYSSKK